MEFTKNNIDRGLKLTIFIVLVDSMFCRINKETHHNWAKRVEEL
jgi:hypothetical protein